MKILKIGAVWCSTCQIMKPRFDQLEKENPQLQTEYFEYDDHPEIQKKYHLEEATLPVFIFVDDEGNELTRLQGDISKKKILETVANYQ